VHTPSQITNLLQLQKLQNPAKTRSWAN